MASLSRKKFGSVMILTGLFAATVFWWMDKDFKSEGFAQDDLNEITEKLHGDLNSPVSSSNPMSVDGLPRNLALDSYIQATLTDKDYSQVLTLRVISETKGDSFFQYEVQSSEGEVGIITLGIDRVFGFLPTKEGVYEYAGSSLDLQFERSVMDKFEGDLYPSTLKELR